MTEAVRRAEASRFASGRTRLAGAAAAALLFAQPADAKREVIGIFSSWGAFSDAATAQCNAVAEPVPELSQGGGGSPAYVAVSDWPRRGVLRQIAVRLSHPRRADARLTLSIGDSRFALDGNGNLAWARDPREDVEIVAAVRSGRSMSVETVSSSGVPFVDVYRLGGAASAIDAATLACTKL